MAKYSVGDIIRTDIKDQSRLLKILHVDSVDDIYHTALYSDHDDASLNDTYRESAHMPLAISELDIRPATHIGNTPVTPTELSGYSTYLSATDPVGYQTWLTECAERATIAYRQAATAADDGDTEAAITHYLEAHAWAPQFFEALNNAGLLYIELARYEEAVAMFEQSLAINTDNPTARRGLGVAYYRAGEKEKSLAVYKTWLEREPDNELAQAGIRSNTMSDEEILAELNSTTTPPENIDDMLVEINNILDSKKP